MSTNREQDLGQVNLPLHTCTVNVIVIVVVPLVMPVMSAESY